MNDEDTEPTPELVAEIEDALRPGDVSNEEIADMAEGLHALMHGIGGLEYLHDRWKEVIEWTKALYTIAVAEDDLDGPVVSAGVDTFADHLRVWVPDVASEIAGFLHDHDIPWVDYRYRNTLGEPRFVVIKARARD